MRHLVAQRARRQHRLVSRGEHPGRAARVAKYRRCGRVPEHANESACNRNHAALCSQGRITREWISKRGQFCRIECRRRFHVRVVGHQASIAQLSARFVGRFRPSADDLHTSSYEDVSVEPDPQRCSRSRLVFATQKLVAVAAARGEVRRRSAPTRTPRAPCESATAREPHRHPRLHRDTRTRMRPPAFSQHNTERW